MKTPMLPALKTQRERVLHGCVERRLSSKVATRPILPSVEEKLPQKPIGIEISILFFVTIEISGIEFRCHASDRRQDDTDGEGLRYRFLSRSRMGRSTLGSTERARTR